MFSFEDSGMSGSFSWAMPYAHLGHTQQGEPVLGLFIGFRHHYIPLPWGLFAGEQFD